MLLDGSLTAANLPNYLAYSIKILQLSEVYQWVKVLQYDRAYRYMQARDKFTWGVEQSHLLMLFLMGNQGQGKGKQGMTGPPNSKFTFPNSGHKNPPSKPLYTSEGREICMNFNGIKGCKWGQGCRYVHACSAPGCGKSHARHQHAQ